MRTPIIISARQDAKLKRSMILARLMATGMIPAGMSEDNFEVYDRDGIEPPMDGLCIVTSPSPEALAMIRSVIMAGIIKVGWNHALIATTGLTGVRHVTR